LTVGELAGQVDAAAGGGLTLHFAGSFAGSESGPGGQDDSADDLIGGGGVRVQPGFQGRTHEVVHQRRHLRVVEPFLGLTLEHRLAAEHGHDADNAFANVLGGDLQTFGFDFVGGHEVANGLGDAGLEAVFVGAAGGSANAVDVGTNGF